MQFLKISLVRPQYSCIYLINMRWPPFTLPCRSPYYLSIYTTLPTNISPFRIPYFLFSPYVTIYHHHSTLIIWHFSQGTPATRHVPLSSYNYKSLTGTFPFENLSSLYPHRSHSFRTLLLSGFVYVLISYIHLPWYPQYGIFTRLFQNEDLFTIF